MKVAPAVAGEAGGAMAATAASAATAVGSASAQWKLGSYGGNGGYRVMWRTQLMRQLQFVWRD